MATVIKTDKLPIKIESDIGNVRKYTREYSVEAKFNLLDQTKIITAASELARNSFQYAKNGCVIIELLQNDEKTGVSLLFKDDGPGIENISLAMKDGYSSLSHLGSLGLGLPGAKRLVNEFYISSEIGKGTEIKIIRWK